tara:strand:+ start:362 stop:856 length:495 start_codon:yes stop_codon:yes gene_type:complete
MAFNTNTVAGTVVHAQSQWNTKLIVPNDISITSSTTYQSILKFDLGKYERAVFRCYLDVAYDADGDLKYKIVTPTNTVSYRARNMVSEAPISGAVTEAVTFDVTTAGSPEVAVVGSDGDYYAFIEGTITAGDTAGYVDLQAAQNTSSGTATVVKFGTYLEYLKF